MRRTTVSSLDSWRSVVSSWASSESLSPAIGGGAASDRMSPSSESKSRRALRHSADGTGGKDMAFDGGHDVRVKVGRLAGDAESAVAAEASGPAGDLADLLRIEAARAPAVELAQAGEGDVVDVHVEAHPDRVGRDQEIDFAELEELDLGVARARAQGAHHHRRAAAMAADQFGDRIDRLGRKGDDGAAARQAGQLLRTGVGQRRQALAELDLGIRTEAADKGNDGRRAEQHRLRAPARVQQAMGEDVAALGIGAELDFVDREEFHPALERHRLDRADEILRMGGDDLFLAGDQRDPGRAFGLHHPVVDFPRQSRSGRPIMPEEWAKHALDREMRLAGVGRAENGDQSRAVRRVGHGPNVEDESPRRK